MSVYIRCAGAAGSRSDGNSLAVHTVRETRTALVITSKKAADRNQRASAFMTFFLFPESVPAVTNTPTSAVVTDDMCTSSGTWRVLQIAL